MNNLIIISWPTIIDNELSIVNHLFKSGLKQFHIRKPEFTSLEMRNYINSIDVEYRKYLVLHSHFHLAEEMDLLGIQVGVKRVEEAEKYKNAFKYFGYSAHSFSEVVQNKEIYSHFFLSPIFNSISKTNYKAKYSQEELSVFLVNNAAVNIIALGGIALNNYQVCFDLGFSSVALLGTIWENENPVLAFRKMLNISK